MCFKATSFKAWQRKIYIQILVMFKSWFFLGECLANAVKYDVNLPKKNDLKFLLQDVLQYYTCRVDSLSLCFTLKNERSTGPSPTPPGHCHCMDGELASTVEATNTTEYIDLVDAGHIWSDQ